MRIRFRDSICTLATILCFAAGSASARNIPGIIPISGVDVDLPDAELRVIDPLVKGARFVALGESVHGSAGFLKLEHRITKYLVERKGFRLVILENPVIRSAGLTEWVDGCATGRSKGKKLPIDLIYEPTDEDWDFFVWMCDFNRAHRKDPIRFRGMDIWDRPWEHQERMEKLAKKLSLDFESELAITRKHCWAHGDSDWSQWDEYMKILQREKKIPVADYVPCTEALRKMEKTVNQFLGRSLSDRAFYDAHSLIQSIQTSYGFQGNFNFAYQDFGKRWNSRDLAQAKNQYSIWEQEGELRAVLIAHTTHTSKMMSGSDWWKTGFGEFKSGVFFLKQWLGNSVRTIGLTGYDVTGTQGEWAKPTSPESLDRVLHDLGYTVAFVDPYSKFIARQKRWWIQNENDESHYTDGVYMVPKDNFDAFFFVDKTHQGKAILPWRPVFQW